MKRSEINKIIEEGIAFVEDRGLVLPPFAKWDLEQWQNIGQDSIEIVDNMLGWDVTDFGSADFDKVGLLIFTFRNGNFKDKKQYPKPYAEKLLLVGDGQELPYHFHWSKMEDIINRGGGNLLLEIYNSDQSGALSKDDVCVSIDGRQVKLAAGETIRLIPGESITLMPGQYHRWIGEKGTGKVMLFEVSSTNDDRSDNRFLEAGQRLPQIEEDEKPRYLIFNDYKDYCFKK